MDASGSEFETRQAPSQRPPWERSQFRFWVWTISTVALLAAGLSVVAIATSHPRATTSASVASGAATGAQAAAAGPSVDFSAAKPADFQARDPNAPAPLPGTVHDITMHIKETELEVAPGLKQMRWTFDGEVPGPVYRGKVGDTFNFTIFNDGTMTHSLDFHAGMVSPNVAMVSIDPGKSHVYSFVAEHAGIFMYHCGTPPVLLHIANGMYGAVIIDPPNLPAVDHEFVLLQSELYTAPSGQVPDLPKLLNEQYDAVMFNGYVNQYKYAPIRIDPNQRIRVWILDDGPSQSSSFHVIGTIFDTVYKEGAYLLRPGPDNGGSQALDLAPAQGGFVEFTPTEPGNYTFVTHKFNDASRGALGIFQVGDVTSTMSH
jgi:nitrite reductase (NO-forming)